MEVADRLKRTSVYRRAAAARFRRRYAFDEPPPGTDFTGYNPILDVIRRERLYELPGDVLEIGVLVGGGTAKLCGLFNRLAPTKHVIAVDLFDPSFDTTTAGIGLDMAELYELKIGEFGADQRSVFDAVTRTCQNLVVVAGDSAKVSIPTDRLCFSFIDGHHAPEYVRSDFANAWSRTVPGGVVGFHDYGGDLPDLTTTIHALIGEHAEEIERVWVHGIILFAKRR